MQAYSLHQVAYVLQYAVITYQEVTDDLLVDWFIGLMLCLCAGSELFTGNCLLIIPLCCGKILISEMLISWLIVYFGNFIGGLIMALLVVYGHVANLFDSGLAQAIVNNASSKTSLGFGDAFVKGILCNFQ